MTDEDAAIEDWISSQPAVDNTIAFRVADYSSRRADTEVSDKAPWEEGFREVSAKAIFIFITLTSIVTMIIDPKMVAVALPASVLAALLYSMARRGRRRRRRAGAIIPGEEIW